jgi:hypothetical protein
MKRNRKRKRKRKGGKGYLLVGVPRALDLLLVRPVVLGEEGEAVDLGAGRGEEAQGEGERGVGLLVAHEHGERARLRPGFEIELDEVVVARHKAALMHHHIPVHSCSAQHDTHRTHDAHYAHDAHCRHGTHDTTGTCRRRYR